MEENEAEVKEWKRSEGKGCVIGKKKFGKDEKSEKDGRKLEESVEGKEAEEVSRWKRWERGGNKI